jgi:5-guanidino-2-oxopentanoate decarboxylase
MPITVAQYLVDLLAANGIDTVFGIPGVHNLELYRALTASNIRHVLVHHEQGAGFAADGYARMCGRPAAAFVISGPGLTNILTAAAQAYSDSVPMLVIASTPVRASLGKGWGVLHELRDQLGIATGIFGIARAARSAEDVRDHLRACLASLQTGRPRPAYLEIPLDLLSERTTLQAEALGGAAPLPRCAPEPIAAAIRLLEVSQRPLLIAGGGARGAADELRQLVESLDGFLVTTAAGKGVLPEQHPANLGASLPYAQVQALAADADVILAVGTELAETDVYSMLRLPFSGPLLRIDIDPAKLSDHYAADACLWGDAKECLQAINLGIPKRSVGWCKALGGAAALRAQIASKYGPRARAKLSVINAIRAAVPQGGAVFSDMTQLAYFGNHAYPTDSPGGWFHPSGYGTLGFALPAAIGAKIASPARAVLALVGDYGLQFTVNELMTAVEAAQGLPVVIWNNSALGQIREDMEGAQITPIGVVARNPDFAALALAYGAAAIRARTAGDLTEAIRNALVRAGPTLIEVVDTDFFPSFQ